MNISILAILLFIHLSIFAQHNPESVYADSRETTVSQAIMARYAAQHSEDLQVARATAEAKLSSLLEQYHQGTPAQQQVIRIEIRQVLAQLIEIKLAAQESELKQLEAELETLKASRVHGEQHTHMVELQARVEAAQVRINRRRQVVDTIVEKKLEDLLK